MLTCLALGVSACHGGQPLDCTKVDLPRLDSCFDQNRTKGEPASAITCLPFSGRLKTSGIWVVGFERSAFFEGWGARLPPADIMWNESTGADLIVDDKMLKTAAPDAGRLTYALQVDVLGRRALCPVGALNAYPIAVEQLTVKRRIGVR